MRTYLRSVILLFIIFYSNSILAQQKEIGTWNNLMIKKGITDKWSVYSELQLRSLSFYERLYYYEIKFGLNYSFKKNYTLTFGGGLYHTFEEGINYDGIKKNKHIRTWEQFTFSHQLKPFELEHRFRLEQRYYAEFESRFVYKLNLKAPLDFIVQKPDLLYLNVYDEFYTNKHIIGAEQNRLSIGLGIRIDPQFTLQSGWLLYSDFSKSPAWVKNFFVTSVALSF